MWRQIAVCLPSQPDRVLAVCVAPGPIAYSAAGSHLPLRRTYLRTVCCFLIFFASSSPPASQALRTIYDPYNDEEITLTKEELAMVMRIRAGQFPHVEVGGQGDSMLRGALAVGDGADRRTIGFGGSGSGWGAQG